MNSKVIFSAIMAMSLVTGGSAFAQDHGDRDHGDRDHNDRGHEEHARQEERGAGPNHAYHRGDRLPAREHTRQYVVNDWHDRNLRAPPRGYHWVRSGDDYILAAIATGVIADLLLNH